MNSNDLKLNANSEENFTIVCEKHGTHDWEGHFICSECMECYTYDEAEKIERENNGVCVCDKKLLPEDDNDNDFSGVAVCSLCFVELKALNKTFDEKPEDV